VQRTTRSPAEGPASPDHPRLLLALLCLFMAGLACARADVPPPGAVGGGGLPAPGELTEYEEPLASATPLPTRPMPSLAGPSLAGPSPTPAAPEPLVSPTFPATPTLQAQPESANVLYASQGGDSLRAVAIRFGVVPSDIRSAVGVLPPPSALIDPDTLLIIPRRLGATGPGEKLIPDSEYIFSPHASDFDVVDFSARYPGFLNRYQEYISGRTRSGPEVVALAARDSSVNPRVLLAMLEYLTGWLTEPARPVGEAFTYPLGHRDPQLPGLYRQLTWLANELGNGYYGWRAGTLTEVTLSDGNLMRLEPSLNAGTIALHHFFSLNASSLDWSAALAPGGFMAAYRSLFGDPWLHEYPIYEPGIAQPEMILPFLPGHVWAYTGGPHGAWERESAWAALDFAPPSLESGCVPSDDWVVASAAGLVVRSGGGVVVLDLDGDGREQTGWVLLYLHIASDGAVKAGEFIEQGDLIGHPSCEGGIATGTHLHVARKYNGEWILADGPLPFNLSGWTAVAGIQPYQGALVKGDQTVLACPCSSKDTYISR
jgi:LasA protease